MSCLNVSSDNVILKLEELPQNMNWSYWMVMCWNLAQNKFHFFFFAKFFL